jgi:glycosyltransferase involved in cell wall biosynthesis
LILLLHEFNDKPWYYQIVTQAIARISDAVVCHNKSDHQLLARQGGIGDKLFHIPLGSSILPPPGYAWQPRTNNQAYLVYFGFIFEDKGLDYLVSAMEMLQNEFSYLKLFIIGDLSHRRGDPRHIQALKDRIAALGLTDKIIFTDRLSSLEVSRYMQNASCMVLPFTQGISGRRSSTECAMLHRVPLISTKGPKRLPNIIHGKHVWLVPPRDPAALANAIKMVIRDGDLQKRLSEGCAAWSAQRNWREIAKSFTGIMRHTLRQVQNRP